MTLFPLDRVNRSTSTRILAFAALFAASALAATPSVAPVVQGKFAPKDECVSVPGAASFRAALAEAIRRRDAGALVALADPDIKLDFGGGEGHAELRQRLAGEGGAALWRELADLLPLGCAADPDGITLPWFFAQDLGTEDPFNTLLVTGARVPLLPRADAAARPLRLLSWALVEPREGYDESAEFQPVRLLDGGVEGFVAANRLRSPIGYRLIASRSSGSWKIETFIAGD